MQTKDIQAAANEHYGYRFDDEIRKLIALVDDSAGDGYGYDDGDALERLEEMPLGFDKLITNHRDETITWEILLGTGGPADRVVVVTDYDGIVQSAVYEFQDWFQPWTAAEDQDEALVRLFAEIVGCYEPEN